MKETVSDRCDLTAKCIRDTHVYDDRIQPIRNVIMNQQTIYYSVCSILLMNLLRAPL